MTLSDRKTAALLNISPRTLKRRKDAGTPLDAPLCTAATRARKALSKSPWRMGMVVSQKRGAKPGKVGPTFLPDALTEPVK